MSNYGDLQSRIADEIKRTNLTQQIKNAIQTAISAYESRPFFFNQCRATMPTVANVKIYALPDDFKKMRFLRIQWTSTTWEPLEELSKGDLVEWDTSQNLTGIPEMYYIDWAQKTTFSNDQATTGQLWLLPIANGVHTMELSYFRDLGTLSVNGDENAWTDEGELLIRCRAKRELYTHVIKDTNEALKLAATEQDAYRDLQRGNTMRRAPGRLRANW